jgi:hypothetical protein
MKKIKFPNLSSPLYLFLAAFMMLALLTSFPRHSSAAVLTNTIVRLNRMKAGTDSTWRLVFKPAGSGATSVSVNFGAAWTGASGTVSATQAASGTAGCDVSATAAPGVSVPSGSGTTVSATVTSLTGGTWYCMDFTTSNSVHTPSAGTYYPVVTVGSDSQTTAVNVVSNDQISLTATVQPAFSLGISACGGGGNTDTFTGNLTAGSVVSTSGCTLSLSTNAKNGWYAWAADLNGTTGLNSTNASHQIAWSSTGSQTDLSGTLNTEGYVFAVNSTVASGTCYSTCGTVSLNSFYDDTASHTSKGAGLSGSFTSFASSNGVANNYQMIVKERSTINPTTPPASDYSDAITIVGAGNF